MRAETCKHKQESLNIRFKLHQRYGKGCKCVLLVICLPLKSATGLHGLCYQLFELFYQEEIRRMGEEGDT